MVGHAKLRQGTLAVPMGSMVASCAMGVTGPEPKHSAESYKLLFDKSPQPMWVFDRASLAFLAVNEAAIEHYGYSREEFLSMTIKDIRGEADVRVAKRRD